MNVGGRRVLGEKVGVGVGGGGLTTNMYTAFLRVSSNGSSFTVDYVNIRGPGNTQ